MKKYKHYIDDVRGEVLPTFTNSTWWWCVGGGWGVGVAVIFSYICRLGPFFFFLGWGGGVQNLEFQYIYIYIYIFFFFWGGGGSEK